MTVIRPAMLVALALLVCGCVNTRSSHRELHNRVLDIYSDPALLTRAEYDAAVSKRLRVRRQTDFGLDVRPPNSKLPAYISVENAISWTPPEAFISTYFDFSETIRADVERRLGPPVVGDRGGAYWDLTTGILIVDVDPLQSMMFYPSRYAQLPDLVEVPGVPRIPTREESTARLVSLQLTRSGFTRQVETASRIQFWNKETRELIHVGRRTGGTDAVYVGYLVPRQVLSASGTGFIMDLLAQLGLDAHRASIQEALNRVAAEDRVEPFSIDNIVYEIEGQPSGYADGRQISITACDRRLAPQRNADYGSPCSSRF